MTATELFEMLRQNNGQTIHVPQGLAIQFIEECKEKELRINCTMEFHDGVCKIVTHNKILSGPDPAAGSGYAGGTGCA